MVKSSFGLSAPAWPHHQIEKITLLLLTCWKVFTCKHVSFKNIEHNNGNSKRQFCCQLMTFPSFCISALFNQTPLPTKLKVYFGHSRCMTGLSKGYNLQSPKGDVQICNIYENSPKKFTFTISCNLKNQKPVIKFSS